MNDELFVAIINNNGLVKNISADIELGLSEQLLGKIDAVLTETKVEKNDLTNIAVVSSGGTFSSLRTAVVSANALGFSLNIPVVPISKGSNVVEVIKQCTEFTNSDFKAVLPVYDHEPNITKPKS